MIMKWFYLILFLLIKIGSDITSKEYGIQNKFWIWIIAMIGYIIATVLWLLSFKQGMSLSIAVPVTSVIFMIIAVLIGSIIYKESFSINHLFGLLFGLISVYLLTKMN